MNFEMELVIMMAYKEARDRYAQEQRQINECIALQESMVLFFRPTTQGNRPMTTDEQDALEDRLNNEGKYTAFIFDKVSLHGDYTAEDLFEIWKLLKPELIATLEYKPKIKE